MKRITLSKIGIVATAFALLLPAAEAQTRYGPANFWGGYKEKEIEPGIWRVRATSNGASGGGRFSAAMAAYRAAELMKAKGFEYFRVLDANLSMTELLGPLFPELGPGYVTLLVRGANGKDDTDGCREKLDKSRCVTVSVSEIMNNLEPVVYKRKH